MNFSIIQLFNTFNRWIHNNDDAESICGNLLIQAAESDRVFLPNAHSKEEEIQHILSMGNIYMQDRSVAAVLLAQKSQFDCLAALIKNGRLTQEARDQIFMLAINSLEWPTIHALLSLGVSETNEMLALQLIAAQGTESDLAAFLRVRADSRKLFKQAIFDSAVSTTSSRGELEMVKALLDYENVSRKGCFTAIRKAIRCRAKPIQSRKIVRFLLQKNGSLGLHRVMTAIQALARGRFDIAWDCF